MAYSRNSYAWAVWQDEEIPRANSPMPRVSDRFSVCVRVSNGAETREGIFSMTRAAFQSEQEMRASLSAALLRLNAGLPAYLQEFVMHRALDAAGAFASDPQNASPEAVPLTVEVLVPDFDDPTSQDVEIIGDQYNYGVCQDDGVWQDDDGTVRSAGEGTDGFLIQLRICNRVEVREGKFFTTRDPRTLGLNMSAAFITMGARLSLRFQDSIAADILDLARDPRSASQKVVPVRVDVIVPQFEDTSDMAMEESFQDTQASTVPATKSSIEALEKVTALDSSLEADCVVCLQELVCGGQEIARMPCRHMFHGDCIVQWLETSHLCPLCRFAMPC